MTSENASGQGRGPALLCYDGSDSAAHAIEQAGRVLGGGPATVLTVWESVGSAVLRHPVRTGWEMGREIGEISNDVVDELDASTAEWARATAAEGVVLAESAGFDARALAHRALGAAGERSESTVWRSVIDVAADEGAAVVVLASRGRSGLKAALLGSVSYGVVHNTERPVLVVPSPR